MAADGTITFNTSLDNSQLEKDLQRTGEKIEELQKKLEERTSDRNAIKDSLEAANAALNETEASIERLSQRFEELQEMNANGLLDDDAYHARVEAITEELGAQNAKYKEQLNIGEELARIQQQNENEIKDLTTQLDAAQAKEKTLSKEYSKSYGVAAANFNASMDKMNGRFDAFMGKITKRIKKLFVFSFIFGALSSLKKYLMSAVKENQAFQASTAYLSATLAGLAAPVLKVVIPALTAAVNVITVMLTTLARLVDMVFKTNFVEQIAAARNAAAAQQQATKATNDDVKATNKLAKAKKEAMRWLAAFDELNLAQKAEDDTSDESTPLDTIGGIDDAGIEGATWDGIDVGKIDEKLAEIMLILGAALLAVGAILAFSGINIPLGITLMAIGALMIYTAVAEQWDKLPQELRDAVTAALVITGLALIVIGAILAFSGANIPLGIGMIAAGALLIWTAAAINWDTLPEEMKPIVSGLLALLSGALLVIGGILAFSGGGTPLGIGLMVLGAASLAAVAAINWDSMPDEMKRIVTDLGTFLGGALLVIGAILALSGAAAPLGVGLMLAGAVTLASVAALNWSTMPQNVRDVVSTIAAIIGAELIVIGIILVATGVALPLGVALIVAGAASLAGVVAINFDAIKDKIKEIWDGIVSWFNSTVAPVFTVEFWQDKFKTIANGLIGALNWALGGAGDFINNLSAGLSDILNFWGVGGYSFSIAMPQIPYLAKGAVIPPNREFMAVLGDQTSGNNIEAPEALLRQIVNEESGNAQLVTLLTQILQAVQNGHTLQCDGVTLAKVVNDRNAAGYKLYGW